MFGLYLMFQLDLQKLQVVFNFSQTPLSWLIINITKIVVVASALKASNQFDASNVIATHISTSVKD